MFYSDVKKAKEEFVREFLDAREGIYRVGIGKDPHPGGELVIRVSGEPEAIAPLPDMYHGVRVVKRVGAMGITTHAGV